MVCDAAEENDSNDAADDSGSGGCAAEDEDANGNCPSGDGGDSTTLPDYGFGSEYTSQLSEEELAARMKEREAGITDPTGVGSARPDPDALATREGLIRERAGNLINPGAGEAGGPPVSAGPIDGAADPCDLAAAGGEPGEDCPRGDGLQQ